MMHDPFVEELHRVRKAHAARCGNDLRRLVNDLKQYSARHKLKTVQQALPHPRHRASS